MGEVFKEIKIDNELSAPEKIAIDNIKSIQPDELKKALTTEQITVKDANKKMTFMDIADAFTKYKVVFPANEVIKDDYGNNSIKKTQGTFEGDIPQRLKTLILDPDQNDFAYFLSVVSNVFEKKENQKADIDTFGEQTMKQLLELKSTIISVSVPASGAPVGETAPTPVETVSEKIEIQENDVNDIFTKYGIKKDAIVTAINTLKRKNPDLAKTIIPLLKLDNVKAVQIALGMTENATNLSNNADGRFGKRSLANLANGEVVKYTQKQKVEKGVEKTVVEKIVEERRVDRELTTNTNPTQAVEKTKIFPKKVEKKEIKKTQERFTIAQIQEQLKDYDGEDKNEIVAAIQKQVTVNKNQISAFQFKDKFIVIAKNEIKVFFTKWDAIQFATPKINENFLRNKNTWEKTKINLKNNALAKVDSMQVYTDNASKMRINGIPGIIFENEEELDGFTSKIKELINTYGYTIPYFRNSYSSATSPFYQGRGVNVLIEKDNKFGSVNLTNTFANKITTPAIAKDMVKYLNSLQCWYNPTPKKETLAIT